MCYIFLGMLFYISNIFSNFSVNLFLMLIIIMNSSGNLRQRQARIDLGHDTLSVVSLLNILSNIMDSNTMPFNARPAAIHTRNAYNPFNLSFLRF